MKYPELEADIRQLLASYQPVGRIALFISLAANAILLLLNIFF